MRREVNRILRIWAQTLVPPAITMTLYFLIFGGLIGSRVGKMDGIDYMEFIVPGLVMMSIIQNSYGNISSSFFGAKFGRHVEELLVSPMPNGVILGGYVAGAVLRGLMVGVIVLVIAMLFTPVRMPASVRDAHHRAARRDDLLARRLRQRGVREEVRRHRARADLHPHPAHVSRRRVLFGEAAARMGADAHAPQPDLLHGQRVPLRPAGRQRRAAVGRLRADARLRRRAVGDGLWLLKRGVGLRS